MYCFRDMSIFFQRMFEIMKQHRPKPCCYKERTIREDEMFALMAYDIQQANPGCILCRTFQDEARLPKTTHSMYFVTGLSWLFWYKDVSCHTCIFVSVGSNMKHQILLQKGQTNKKGNFIVWVEKLPEKVTCKIVAKKEIQLRKCLLLISYYLLSFYT